MYSKHQIKCNEFFNENKTYITFFRKAQIIFCAFWALFHMASSISKRSSGTFIHIWHGIIVANTVCASSLKIFLHYIHNKPITAIFSSQMRWKKCNKDMNYDTYFSKEFWKMHFFLCIWRRVKTSVSRLKT